MNLPNGINTIKTYTNRVGGNQCTLSGTLNGESVQIGMITGSSDSPNIFDISEYTSITVRVDGAATHAYWILY